MTTSIELLGWNVNQGGYDRRHIFDQKPTEAEAVPERERAIHELIHLQHDDGVDTMALVDTYGWRHRYGSNEVIAAHFGFQTAAFIDLADDRIDKDLGSGAGLTFMTNHPVEAVSALDLDNRQGIKSILAPDGEPTQIATVYFDDMNEERRRIQLRAALAGLEKDLPTVLVGDFNSLRPNLDGASLKTKMRDLGFRAIVFSLRLIPKQETIDSLLLKINKQKLAAKLSYYRQALTNLNQRQLISELEGHGFRDSDPKRRPTIRKLGRLGVDYAFGTANLRMQGFRIIPADKASDHDAIRLTIGSGSFV